MVQQRAEARDDRWGNRPSLCVQGRPANAGAIRAVDAVVRHPTVESMAGPAIAWYCGSQQPLAGATAVVGSCVLAFSRVYLRSDGGSADVEGAGRGLALRW